MTRVSENSKNDVLQYNLSRAKGKLEGLQLKGSSLKRITRPSDDPAGSVNLLALRSQLTDNQQFIRNLNYAKSHLALTENAISDLSGILSRAKEIAIAHSSGTLGLEAKIGAAKEVGQLFKQSLSIANRKMGDRYLFGGHVIHQKPFDSEGKYLGDKGRSFIEARKDFFVPINITGLEVFFGTDSKVLEKDSFEPRAIASQGEEVKRNSKKRDSVFNLLDALEDALRGGSSRAVQHLLDPLDQAFSRMITLRTRVGAVHHSVVSAEVAIGDDNVESIDRRSKIEDADIGSLFSELEKQSNILEATYQTGASLIDKSLLDFIR